MQACKVWLERYPAKAGKPAIDYKACLQTLIEKCVAPGKPQIKKFTGDILCQLFEKGEKTEVLEVLVENIKKTEKQHQKTVVAAVQCVTELLQNYGPKRLDFMKPFFVDIEKQACSTVAVVKAECMTFYKEAQKWVGDALIKNFTKNLKEQQ